MTDRPSVLRIALPSQSSHFFYGTVLPFLDAMGLSDIAESSNHLVARTDGLEYVFARGFDIPRILNEGLAHAGIVGYDCLVETDTDTELVCALGRQYSQIVLAVQTNSLLREPTDFRDGDLIASEYPMIATRFFAAEGRRVRVIPVKGAVEAYAHLPNIQGIVGLSTTGQTLQRSGLRVLRRILDSEPHFVLTHQAARYLRSSDAAAQHRLFAAKLRELSQKNPLQRATRTVYVRSTGLPQQLDRIRSEVDVIHSVLKARFPHVQIVSPNESHNPHSALRLEQDLRACSAADALIFHLTGESMQAAVEAKEGRRHRKYVIMVAPDLENAVINAYSSAMLPSVPSLASFIADGHLDAKLALPA